MSEPIAYATLQRNRDRIIAIAYLHVACLSGKFVLIESNLGMTASTASSALVGAVLLH